MSDAPDEKVSKNALATVNVQSRGGGAMVLPETMADVVNFSQIMAKADIALPKHLRGNPGACLGVTLQSLRWEMDPFTVANKSYSVNDRLAYEAQLIAAVVHTRAPIKGRPSYIYTGEGETRRCQIVCVMEDGEEREYTSPEIGKIKVQNSPLWKSDPDQQLGYFAIRSWARRHAPEVILGVYSPDEVAQFRDITPKKAGIADKLAASTAATGDDRGFSRSHVASVIGGDVVDGEFIEVAKEPLVATAEPADAEPAPEPSAAAGDLFSPEPTEEQWATWDHQAWVKGQMDAATAIKDNPAMTQADIRNWWTTVEADAAFDRLLKIDEAGALALKAHVVRASRKMNE